MNILITDGYKKADFLLSQMCCSEHEITFVHDDELFAQKMLEKYNIDTYIGDTSSPSTYRSLEREHYDVLICLSNQDHKNYVICKMVPNMLDVTKRITMIANPNNQKSFKQLGIEGTVSASHLVSDIINRLATIDEAMNYISIGDSTVVPVELVIKIDYKSIGKKLMDLNFPESCIVCCIIRGDESIIPNGSDVIHPGDRVVVFTTQEQSDSIIKVFL